MKDRVLPLLAALLMAAWVGDAFAAPDSPAGLSTTTKTKNSVWSFGFNGASHSLESQGGSNLTGNSMAVQLGRGYIGENWFTNVTLDIISGPYQSPQRSKPKLDYTGTGVTAFLGFSPAQGGIRGKGGRYGFGVGLSYADIIGRSSERTSSTAAGETIDNLRMRVTNFSAIPAVYYAWLEDARPDGNRPQDLVTRIEGYFVTLGVAHPILASYQLAYQSTPLNEPTVDVRQKGDLRGQTIILYLTALLGI